MKCLTVMKMTIGYLKEMYAYVDTLFQCNNGGCLIELTQQLAVIMIGKQMINNAQEILIP